MSRGAAPQPCVAAGRATDGSGGPEAAPAGKALNAAKLPGLASAFPGPAAGKGPWGCTPRRLPGGLTETLPVAAGAPRHAGHGISYGARCGSEQPAAIGAAAEYLI